MERRLATILAADVAGHTHLTRANEEGATERLKRLRGILASRVAEAGGKIFGEAGDKFMVEFASPVKAVRCGVEIQRDLALKMLGGNWVFAIWLKGAPGALATASILLSS